MINFLGQVLGQEGSEINIWTIKCNKWYNLKYQFQNTIEKFLYSLFKFETSVLDKCVWILKGVCKLSNTED